MKRKKRANKQTKKTPNQNRREFFIIKWVTWCLGNVDNSKIYAIYSLYVFWSGVWLHTNNQCGGIRVYGGAGGEYMCKFFECRTKLKEVRERESGRETKRQNLNESSIWRQFEKRFFFWMKFNLKIFRICSCLHVQLYNVFFSLHFLSVWSCGTFHTHTHLLIPKKHIKFATSYTFVLLFSCVLFCFLIIVRVGFPCTLLHHIHWKFNGGIAFFQIWNTHTHKSYNI